MKKIRTLVLLAGLSVCFWAVPAEAQGVWGACQGENASSAICGDKTEGTTIAKRLINVFLSVIGALSVIMIIHSGFKYVSSSGDSEKIKSAKNTLLYAVIGLIVAMLALTIVNFVIAGFSGTV